MRWPGGLGTRCSQILLITKLVLAATVLGCQVRVSPGNSIEGSSDNSGQSVKQTVFSDAPYEHSKVVCDPFADPDGGGVGSIPYGVRGNLYYIPEGPLQSSYSRVDDYINYGTNTNVFVFMDQISVPTRMFDRGFEAMDGHILELTNRQPLMEWFALNIESMANLAQEESPGLYQFAVLSDDGAVLSIKDYTADNVDQQPWQTLINNDGWTPTRMACANKALNLAALDRVPIRLRYFQGPRYHISLTLMWRKVAANTPDSLNDPLCGASGNSLFFDPSTVPSTPQQAFLDLQARGWKVLSAKNYTLPRSIRPAPCSDNF